MYFTFIVIVTSSITLNLHKMSVLHVNNVLKCKCEEQLCQLWQMVSHRPTFQRRCLRLNTSKCPLWCVSTHQEIHEPSTTWMPFSAQWKHSTKRRRSLSLVWWILWTNQQVCDFRDHEKLTEAVQESDFLGGGGVCHNGDSLLMI